MEQLYPLVFNHTYFLTQKSQQPQKYKQGRVFSKQAPTLSTFAGAIAIIGGIGAFIFAMILAPDPEESLPLFLMLCLGPPVGAFLFYYLVMRLWFLFVGPRLGEPRLMVSASWLRLGDELSVTYQQPILKDSVLLGGTVELIVRESVRYTCGTDICYAHHDHLITSEAFHSQSLPAGMTLNERFRLTIPEDSMPTFGAKNNKIGWLLRITLSFESLSKYDELFEITVTA